MNDSPIGTTENVPVAVASDTPFEPTHLLMRPVSSDGRKLPSKELAQLLADRNILTIHSNF